MRQGGSWYYDVGAPGFKYNMTDIQAAHGLWPSSGSSTASRQRRREIVAAYNAAFGGIDALEIPVERPEVEHAWHLTCSACASEP